MSESEYRHDPVKPEQDLQVHIPGYEDYALSFIGFPETETVECVLLHPETLDRKLLFETTTENFEMFIQQAIGAKNNSEGDYPNMPPGFEEQRTGENND